MGRMAFVFLLCFCMAPGYAASFDCKKAARTMEKTLCGDKELSQLDEEMALAYKAALKDTVHAGFIGQSQRNWLKQVQECSQFGQCLKERYKRRISELKRVIVTFPAGKLAASRVKSTATLLPDGRVLIAGGEGSEGDLGADASAELYDPVSGRFSKTGSLNDGRSEHLATLLPNGNVLITGGLSMSESVGTHPIFNTVALHEIYDTASGKFGIAENISDGTPVVLANGKVLLINLKSEPFEITRLASLYDPVTHRTIAAGTPGSPGGRGYTATLLKDGKVLIAGGSDACSTAEIYDPVTNSFAATGGMGGCRVDHAAVRWPGAGDWRGLRKR